MLCVIIASLVHKEATVKFFDEFSDDVCKDMQLKDNGDVAFWDEFFYQQTKSEEKSLNTEESTGDMVIGLNFDKEVDSWRFSEPKVVRE
jgi:hypothetical protein